MPGDEDKPPEYYAGGWREKEKWKRLNFADDEGEVIEGDPNGFNIPLGGYPEANERPGIGADWRPADQRMADERRFDEEYNEAQDRQKKDRCPPCPSTTLPARHPGGSR